MRMLKGAIAGLAALMSISGCTQQKTGIEAAADAMGATSLNSIEYSGSGSLFGFPDGPSFRASVGRVSSREATSHRSTTKRQRCG